MSAGLEDTPRAGPFTPKQPTAKNAPFIPRCAIAGTDLKWWRVGEVSEATLHACVGKWPKPGIPLLGQSGRVASGRAFLLGFDCWPAPPTLCRGLHPTPGLL